VECILQAEEVNCNIQDLKGLTALHYHAKYGETQENVFDHDNPLMAHNRERLRAIELQWRASQAQLRAQSAHLRARCQALMNGTAFDDVWEEPLDLGDGTILSALIHAGADINMLDNRGSTPLSYAARAGHLAIVVALLGAGANVDLPNNKGMTPLHFATKELQLEVAEALLQAGANVDLSDKGGLTSLHRAVMKENKEAVNLLLQNGANPNAQGKFGAT